MRCKDHDPMSTSPTLTPSFIGKGEMPIELVIGGTTVLPFSDEE